MSLQFIGVVAAATLCSATALAVSFRLPPLYGADERSHMSYTVSMISGHLPEIDDPLPGTDPRFPILGTNMGPDGQPPPRRGPYFFVANHPPLFYAVAAGPVRLAAESSDDVAPALTLRVLNALFMGLGVALTGWAAAKIFPGRGRQVTVVAAGVAAVLPVVVGNAALGYNDGLALALNAGSLGVMALLLRGGPSRRLVVAATALAAACLLTRASLLPVVAGLAAAALLGAWRRDWRRWPGRGVASSAAIVGGAALAAGWFYARNIVLYGDATGASYLLPRLGRVPRGSASSVLRTVRHHETMWKRVFGHVPDQHLEHPHALQVVLAVLAVALAGAVVGVCRSWWRRRRPSDAAPAGTRSGRRPDGVGIGALVFVGVAAMTIVSVADYVSQGGGSHGRYYIALVPLLGIGLARAVAELPLGRVVAVAIIGGVLSVTVTQLRRYDSLVAWKREGGRLLLDGASADGSSQWAAVVVAAAAFAVLVVVVLLPAARWRRPAAAAADPS